MVLTRLTPRSGFAPPLPAHLTKPRPRTTRTDDEIIEYRRVVCGIPSPLDIWIREAIEKSSAAPTVEPPVPESFLSRALRSRQVDVCFTVLRREGNVEGPFQDPPMHFLRLTLRLPASSGFLAYYRASPTVHVTHYEGEEDSLDAPEWITLIGSTTTFSKPRSDMVDFMRFLATLVENEHVAHKVRAWCTVVSSVRKDLIDPVTIFHPRPTFVAIKPRNQRSHKPRPWDLSARESESLREKANNGGSPTPKLRNGWSSLSLD